MKKRFLLIIHFVCAVITFSGCATTVPIRTVKAPEFDLSQYRNIGLMTPYITRIFNGESGHDFYNLDLGSQYNQKLIELSISSYYFNYIYKNKFVSTQDPMVGKYEILTDLLEQKLGKSEFLRIYKPDAFISKQSESDYLNGPFQKMSVNKDIQAYLIPYAVCYVDIEYSYSSSGLWETTQRVVKTYTIKFGYKVFNLQGQMIFDRRFFDSYIEENPGDESIAWDNKAFKIILEKQVQKMARQLLPGEFVISVELQKDRTNNPLMKEAEKLVQQKCYVQAKDLYAQIFIETKNPAAAVNAAIMFRAIADWTGGMEWLKEAAAVSGDPVLVQELKNMETEQEMQLLYAPQKGEE